MFRITNIQTRQQETCSNRDELLSIINEQSVWAEDRQEHFTLQLEQLSEEGGILDDRTISLPLQSIVEEALSGFGMKKEKKGFSLLSRHKPQKTVYEEEPTQKTEQELVEPVSAPQVEILKTKEPLKREVSKTVNVKSPKTPKTENKILGAIWKLFAIGAFGISITSLMLLQAQTQKFNTLNQRLKLEETRGTVEVVGRFFIANYYSGNSSSVAPFLSKDLKAAGVEMKSDEQVLSSIYETVSSDNGITKITFVVTVKEKPGDIKTVRLALSFKKEKDSLYGYILVRQPQFSSFIK